MVVATLSALAALVAASPGVAADPPPDPRARQRRDAVEQLKKGAAASDVAGRLVAGPDVSGGLLAAVDCVVWLATASRDAVTRREAQSRELFDFYRTRFLTRANVFVADSAAYEGLRLRNRDLCAEVAAREADLAKMQDAARALGTVTPSAEPAASTLADAVRATLRTTHDDAVRARVIDALRGPFVAALAPELELTATKGDLRRERVAALRCLSSLGRNLRLGALRTCLDDEDPFVRRATFPVFAAAGTKEAVDALVLRTASEVGVPAHELQLALLSLTGQCLGDSAKAWEEWWIGARDAWTGPPAVPPAVPALRRESTKYFGLSLESMRVLFVVDCSGSMQFAVSYGGRYAAGTEALESKMAVAQRELVQAITGLPDGASFNVVAFSASMKSFAPRLVLGTRDARRRAQRWIDDLAVDGPTNASGALIDAFESLSPVGRPKDVEIADTIVLLTDGVPTCGPIAHDGDILAEIRRRNPDRAVAVHCVYLGNEGDAKLVTRLASENGGQFVHVKQ